MSSDDPREHPFRPPRRLHKQLEDIFQSVIDEPWGRVPHATWNPAVDLHETQDEYILLADLPGVAPEDVKIEVSVHEVTICGTRRNVRRSGPGRCLCVERMCGHFSRTFHLELPVDPKDARTTMKNGIYEVHLKKLVSL